MANCNLIWICLFLALYFSEYVLSTKVKCWLLLVITQVSRKLTWLGFWKGCQTINMKRWSRWILLQCCRLVLRLLAGSYFLLSIEMLVNVNIFTLTIRSKVYIVWVMSTANNFVDTLNSVQVMFSVYLSGFLSGEDSKFFCC